MAAPKLERLKAADVCQIAQVQPYVLRTWEAEFPDLGQVTAGGPRIYGRADVERVLKIRELVYVEGLTLSGARRRMEESRDDDGPVATAADFSLVDDTARARLQSVREGLQGLLALLERPVIGVPFELVAAKAATERPAAKPARRSKR
ncbi:MAG: MerR family transcriptional regulator [Acidobacteria bacterium]|nr:MerR family transcriptional regulator [Acidobacteriota bacterium]